MYEKSEKIIKKYKNKFETLKKPFEFVIKKLFNNIKNIDYNLSCDKYNNTDGIQYIKNKPFLMSSSLTIEERVNLDHFKIWFSYLINIVNKYPEIKKYKCVKESLQVSKYFLANLSRFIINFTKLSNKKKE